MCIATYCHSQMHLSDCNTVKLSIQFNPAAPFQPDDQVDFKSVTLQDKIHCVVYVLDAAKVSFLPSKVEEKLRAIRQRVNSLGMLLLTHIHPTKH